MGRYVTEALCRLPVEAELASELRYRDPLIDEHTLLIVLSQSGAMADAITKLSDLVVYTHAGPGHGVGAYARFARPTRGTAACRGLKRRAIYS